MSERLLRYFLTYDAEHRHPMCRASHWFGIPVILFTTYAALDWIGLFQVGGREGFEFSFQPSWRA